MTILTQAYIPYAVRVSILMVANQVKVMKISALCNSILLIIPAAKPGPHSTKEHYTSRRWVSLNLGKRSTEIAHDKIEPQSAVLVISRVTNWYTTSVETEEQSKIYKALHLCDYWGLFLASPCKSLMAKFSTRSAVERLSYNMRLATKDIVAPYLDSVGINIIVSCTVTRSIQRRLT